LFTRLFLNDVRQKALRKKVWYRALDRVERGIFSLAAQLIDEVKSEVLGVELVKILRKLRDAMKSGFVRCMEGFGVGKARMVAMQAVGFGYDAAVSWASDEEFIRFFTFLKMNALPGWPMQ